MDMKDARVALIGVVLVAVFSPLALAHHSAIEFDFRKFATVEGVVKQFDVINPHSNIVLTVTDAKGTRDVTFEGHSRNNFYRAGWRPDAVKIGDRIKVTFATRKDGVDGGFVNSFVTAHGQEIGFRAPSNAGGSQSAGK
jgi:hypothetical protein